MVIALLLTVGFAFFVFLLVPAQAFVANWLQSFREFPPRQKPASFSLDQVMDTLVSPGVRAN